MEDQNVDQLQKIWNDILNAIKPGIDISKPGFEAWLKTTKPLTLFNNRIILEVPNEFAKDWLESRYLNLIKDKIKETQGNDLEVILATPEDTKDLINEKKEEPISSNKNKTNSQSKRVIKNKKKQEKKQSRDDEVFTSHLNPKYTFDSFVIGSSNRFAHAASLAVAEAPAKAYNPLFIYGGVGLGKTHLLHAVGQFILKDNPESNVVYVSSEKFTNDMINSIRDDKTVAFRNKYRTIDVLLIDDIQFLADKERTQEEFFHTFNSLYDSHKQLVISSDRPPKEIPTLEERLRSRFEWGLITDIQEPDLETRIAIMRKKAEIEGLEIPNEVMVYIANNIKSNIRELEGALIRVMAYSSLNNDEITEKVAKKALKDILPDNTKTRISVELIKENVSSYYNLTIKEMIAKNRTKNIAFPRQIAMYLTRELTDLSLPEIGKSFGGRHHSTVLHAHEKILNERKENSQLNASLKELESQLNS